MRWLWELKTLPMLGKEVLKSKTDGNTSLDSLDFP